jgi:hypothetical protein
MPEGLLRRHRRFLIITGICVLVALMGLGRFWLAMRPCRFEVETGDVLRWRLSVGSADLLPDGKPGPERTSEHDLALVGIGPDDGQAAWLTGPAGGAPSSLRLVTVPRDGRLRAIERDGRPGEAGVLLAGFDFNLLPLPPEAEQEWRCDVVWAALPATHRAMSCTAKRLRSGAKPEFSCDFPDSVEWVDPQTRRYRQVRGLTVTYRFDTLHDRPLSAEGSFTLYDELPPPGGRRGRRITFALTWVGVDDAGDPARLRQVAAAANVAETWIAQRRRPPAEVLAGLRAADGPFRGLPEGMLARLAGGR